MPAITIPGTSIKYGWQEREKGWGPGMNTNLLVLGVIAKGQVLSQTTTAPPSDPDEGDAYIIPAGATGAWSGRENEIAAFFSDAWVYIEPVGTPMYVIDEAARVYYDGSEWSASELPQYDFVNQSAAAGDFASLADGDKLLGVDVSDSDTAKNLTLSQLAASQAMATSHVKRVVDLTALRAVTGMQANQTVEMVTTGRAGTFRWDSSDLSAEVTADTQMGIYVPPTGQDGSSGAWVRANWMATFGIRPEWFGAVGDAVIDGITLVSATDDAAAFQACIDFIEALQGDGSGTFPSTILLADRGYYIGSMVTTTGNLTLRGPSGPKMTSKGPGAFITGAGGLESLFKLTGFPVGGRAEGAPGALFSTELDHVGFRSYTGGPACAVKSIAVGGPARPMNVLSCHFRGFDDALLFDTTDDQGTTTGVYTVNVLGSVFQGGTYAIHARGPNALGGLVFKGNVSEQGGRILCEESASGPSSLFGTFDISDNLLEGQSDAIHLYAGRAVGRIGPNYWEANTGVSVLWNAEAISASSIQIEHQYTSSTELNMRLGRGASAVKRLSSGAVEVEIFNQGPGGESAALGGPFGIASGETRIIVAPEVSDVVKKSGLGFLPSGGSVFLRVPDGALQHTPSGTLGVASVPHTTSKYAQYALTGLTADAGDVAVICLWIKGPKGSAVGYTLYDSAFSEVSSALPAITLRHNDWQPLFIAVPLSAALTNHRWRIYNESASDDIEISDALCYVQARESDGASNDFDFACPSAQAFGTGVMTASATSVTIAHGMEATPIDVRVTPRGDLGSVWVSGVTDTEIIVECSAAPAADTAFYWSAT